MLTTIVVIITLSFIGLTMSILYFIWNKRVIANDNGRVMFEIDYKNRKIRNINHPALHGIRISNSQKLWSFYSGKWINLDKFLSLMDENTIKKFRNAMHEIEIEKEDKIVFNANMLKGRSKNNKSQNKKWTWFGPKKLDLEVKLFRSEKELICGEIKFFLPNKITNNKFSDRITSAQLAKIEYDFFGFWVFNMRATTSETKNAFFIQMKKALRIYNMKYFLYENKVVLVLPTQSLDYLKKRINKRRLNIERALSKKGNKKYFKQSGILYSDPIKTPKKGKELLIKLDYLIWKSLKLKSRSIFDSQDIPIFVKFKNAYITVEQNIKAQSMETVEVKVKKAIGNRLIIKYMLPDIKDVSPRFITMVLTNNLTRIRMINSYANKIIESKKDTPGILDVNADWLIENAKKLKNKKIIYMIKNNKQTSQELLFAIIMQLQERGILCGIKVRKADVKCLTWLVRVAPKFIVIDREISKIAHKPDMYVKLSAIRKVAAEKGTKIIYETPSKKLDFKQKQVIGLEFYYDYK